MIHVIDEDEKELTLSDGRIEQAIIDTGALLCILDPIQAYLGKANMNSAGGVRPLMKRLGAVAARHGCAVLLVGHLHKAGGKSQYRGLGSVDIFAAARSVLTVGRIPMDDRMRVVINNKNNLSPAGAPQAFGIDPAGSFSARRLSVTCRGIKSSSQRRHLEECNVIAILNNSFCRSDIVHIATEKHFLNSQLTAFFQSQREHLRCISFSPIGWADTISYMTIRFQKALIQSVPYLDNTDYRAIVYPKVYCGRDKLLTIRAVFINLDFCEPVFIAGYCSKPSVTMNNHFTAIKVFLPEFHCGFLMFDRR